MLDVKTLKTLNESDADFISNILQNEEVGIENFQQPEFQVDASHVLALSNDTFLRKDSTQIIYYGRSFLDTWSGRLKPSQAVLLACFDGKRTIADVAALLSKHTGDPMDTAELKVRFLLSFCEALRKNRLVDLTISGDRPIRTYDPRDFAHLEKPFAFKAIYDKPITMMWMPTWVCQTDCIYCFATRKKLAAREMLDDDRVHELLEEAAELGVRSMNVDGGDALCRPGVTDIFAHANELDIQVDLSTKSYVSKKKARDLYNSGIRLMQLGFDAPYPALFDEIVGRKGHFQKTLETIQNCVEVGLKVRTNSILTSKSYMHIRELVELLFTLPLFNIKIASAFRSHYRGGADLLINEEQKIWLRQQIAELRQEYPADKINFDCLTDYRELTTDQRETRLRGLPRCGAGTQSVIITPNGDVVMCEQSPQTEGFIVGNVRDDSILDIWTSEAALNFKKITREQFKGTACETCDVFDTCYVEKGGCFIETVKAYGSRFYPHPSCPKAPTYDAALM